MLKDFQVRVVANACITRVNDGEGTIDQVVSTYPMQTDDRDKVLAYAYVLRPDLAPADKNKD
ncbi:hypothetical protein ACM1RC_27650 [Paenibacillus azoreducens]|uniref:hypothetical protein n=1 Tax=Paenibacillus azoreducens TaxID=116718 RepID=UPI0039F55BBF